MQSVRHEVVAVAVSRCLATTTPAVQPAVSYRDGRRWQRRGPKLPEQRSLILRDGDAGRESSPRLPAAKGVGNQDRVVGSTQVKRWVNAVMSNKRKLLNRLGQQACG